MGSDGGFLSRAPGLEPPLALGGVAAEYWTADLPTCATHWQTMVRGHSVSHTRPVSCRNGVIRKTVDARPGAVALQRAITPSQPAKSVTSGEAHTGARQFARAVLRVVLEVLDGRRSPAQLRPLAEPPVIAALSTLASTGAAPGRELGGATLTRVDVIMSDSRWAEVCAAYDRGIRHFALAARIVRGRSGWRLTAFRVC
ncbi:Rv3235 family protein [Nocardia sp. NPDC057668]|uniref:Rv3235 family protein n=1 Tax=Nocardia sp. NPDC057668 TaxID=3346202 RepID=UPI00366F31A1